MTEIVLWAKQTFAFGNIALTVVILAIGAVLLFWRPRWGRRWIVAVVLGYWFVSSPLGSTLLITPLTRGFHSIEDSREAGPIGAIVVLGGGIRFLKVRSEALAYPSEATTLRVLEAARLFRLFDGRPLVVASGGLTAAGNRASEGEVIADALSRLGVPQDRIVLEERSRNTREQAIHVTGLLRSRGINRFVLVTSPTHLSRATAVFRAQQAEVVPSATALVPEDRPRRRFFVPNTDSLELSDAALYDYAGIVYYWARGWFRPAPPGAGQ